MSKPNTGYTPRQRQRIRQTLTRTRHERAQWVATFMDWDTGDIVRCPVDAGEASLAVFCGYERPSYAEISLEGPGL